VEVQCVRHGIGSPAITQKSLCASPDPRLLARLGYSRDSLGLGDRVRRRYRAKLATQQSAVRVFHFYDWQQLGWL
jgi:hypothetical protein